MTRVGVVVCVPLDVVVVPVVLTPLRGFACPRILGPPVPCPVASSAPVEQVWRLGTIMGVAPVAVLVEQPGLRVHEGWGDIATVADVDPHPRARHLVPYKVYRLVQRRTGRPADDKDVRVCR
ncbi:hypothetical protein [Serinicoccus kebangsaanensis]|uniref:hypothetical protein n=1 Tax=Serinicoccus kebangsaanensis TaxID=2602069 RepID=UPI00192DD6F6|nr:hypothetical protein [Serinicoccus kebangsaanensis]